MKNKKPEIRFKGFSEEWEEKELGEEVKITMGQSPNGENYTNNPENHILVQGNADMKNGRVLPRVWTKQITKIANSNDLIFSVRAPVGEVGKTDYDVVIGRGVAAIKGNEFIFQSLIKMNENGYWNQFSAGSTFDSINSNDLSKAVISITSKTEQTQIGNFFKNLDNLITLHQRKYEKLGILKKAMLEKMFPKNGADVPEIRFKGFSGAWEEKTLEEIAEKVSVGIATSSSKYFTNFEDGVPFIKNQDIKDGVIETKTLEAITHQFDEANKTKRIKTGDILTVRTGYPGLSAVVPEKLNNAQTFTTLITRLKANTVNPEFVTIFINSDLGMKQTSGMQAGGAQKNINANTLKNLLIILPSITEQEKIGNYFKNLDNLLTLNQRELEKLQHLKKALLEKMFV